jgi:nucleotide-binding universal stress UspA family protein
MYLCPDIRILITLDFVKAVRVASAAVELASGSGSELHVVHVVPTVPELPYLQLAAREGVEGFFEWRRLKGLKVLDGWVRRIGEDLGCSVAASYYREGKPEKELVLLAKEIDAGLIMIGGHRQARFERVFGANLAEQALRRTDRPVLIVDDGGSRDVVVPRSP